VAVMDAGQHVVEGLRVQTAGNNVPGGREGAVAGVEGGCMKELMNLKFSANVTKHLKSTAWSTWLCDHGRCATE
jgi:hypothetical protein